VQWFQIVGHFNAVEMDRVVLLNSLADIFFQLVEHMELCSLVATGLKWTMVRRPFLFFVRHLSSYGMERRLRVFELGHRRST